MFESHQHHAEPNASGIDLTIPVPWTEPAPSNALRKVAIGNNKKKGSRKVSVRGELVAVFGTPRRIVYESNLEKRTLLCLLTRPDVIMIEDQRPRVSYVDAWGTERTHTFDFRVTLRCGTRIALAVKPAELVAKLGFEDDLRLIADQMSRRDADRVRSFTEAGCPRAAVANAKMVLAMRASPDEVHDRIIAELISTIDQPVRVDALILASGLGPADGFAAIVRLFGDGGLRILGDGVIGHRSEVARTSSKIGGRP